MRVRGTTAAALLASMVMALPASADPPFSDLNWKWTNLITSHDRSRLVEVVPAGTGVREWWEQWRWIDRMRVRLFTARYATGQEIEIQVSPEWRRRKNRNAWGPNQGGRVPWPSPRYDQPKELDRMAAEVEFVANVLGRLPNLLRRRIRAVSLDQGYYFAGAARRLQTLHFYTRLNDRMESVGATEETYLHEVGHLFEDEYMYTDCWRNARRRDGEVISEYAQVDPDEDFAETLVAYYALRYRPDRMAPNDLRLIRETIPARIKCLDGWGFGTGRP